MTFTTRLDLALRRSIIAEAELGGGNATASLGNIAKELGAAGVDALGGGQLMSAAKIGMELYKLVKHGGKGTLRKLITQAQAKGDVAAAPLQKVLDISDDIIKATTPAAQEQLLKQIEVVLVKAIENKNVPAGLANDVSLVWLNDVLKRGQAHSRKLKQ